MNYSGSYREPLGDVDVCKNIITKLFANYNFYNIQVDVEKETKKKNQELFLFVATTQFEYWLR